MIDLLKGFIDQMYTFKKEERLCSKKLLNELFHNGSSFLLYPVRVTWMPFPASDTIPARVVISVPKRTFKRAVDRNFVKRRMREVYRLNKARLFYAFIPANLQIILSLHYIGKDLPDYLFLEKKLVAALAKLGDSCRSATLSI